MFKYGYIKPYYDEKNNYIKGQHFILVKYNENNYRINPIGTSGFLFEGNKKDIPISLKELLKQSEEKSFEGKRYYAEGLEKFWSELSYEYESFKNFEIEYKELIKEMEKLK